MRLVILPMLVFLQAIPQPLWDRLLTNGPAVLISTIAAVGVYRLLQAALTRNAARTDKIIDLLGTQVLTRLDRLETRLEAKLDK